MVLRRAALALVLPAAALAVALAADASIVPGPAPVKPVSEATGCTPGPKPPPTKVDAPSLAAHVRVRAYFYAGGRTRGLGVDTPTENLDGEIPPHLACVDDLRLVVEPDQQRPFGKYRGFRVHLINGTGGEVAIDGQDSRLPLVREAKDDNGGFRDVEYIPRSYCGLSYRPVYMVVDRAWTYVAPEYGGDFETELRFRLDGPNGPVYSNVFTGTIDRRQFEEKQGHKPKSLMDPYNE